MIYATIQFIDSHSASIKDKNLIPIDGKPLWMHNSDMVKFTKETDAKNRIKRSFICTTYDYDKVYPSNGEEMISRAAFNVDKCPLSNRVRDVVHHLNDCKYFIDAYIILLGNSRCYSPISLSLGMDAYEEALRLFPETTGLMSVSNYSMFNPKRAMSLYGGGFANLVIPNVIEPTYCIRIGNTGGEDRHDSEKDSWFFNGGFMIMNAKNEMPRGISNDAWGSEYPTPYPYLGKFVYGYKMPPTMAMELDEYWQLPMMTNEYRMKVLDMAKDWDNQ